MKIVQIKTQSFLLFSLFLLSSCGPIYQTHYTLSPPEGAEGKSCVFQCDNINTQCKQVKDLELQRCESRADIDFNTCEARNVWKLEKDQKSCFRNSCGSSDYTNCESQYRNCYQTCGGKVTGTTVCTAFCGK